MASNGNGSTSYRPTKKTQLAQQQVSSHSKPQSHLTKTSRYDARDNKLHLNEIPIPTPGPNQLLVKIGCASLCHSDVMLFEPNDAGLVFADDPEPITIGHEGSGWVAGLGANVTNFKEGDAVGFLPVSACWECEKCRKAHNFWCVNGPKMNGFASPGFFQEYAVVDAHAAMVLPSGMDPRTAAPLFCAGVTSFHGVDDCELKPGQWMAIIGTGGLGHLGVQYAKAMGLKVIGLDISDAQLETAKQSGADYVFNSMTDKDYVKKILELTDGGVDAAVNFTASKKAYEDSPAIIKTGTGLLMFVGIPTQPVGLNALDVAMGRYRIKGSNNGTPNNLKPAIEFSAKHNITPHLTLFKLEELPKMIQIMHDNKTQGRLGVQFVS
ncbi:GroES-like protein [Microthyrium microscopicum]|uniref:GroES-like protein n=1 Tax=Microthyrium microscopicum TaxID=703497 RepID=A0A6A6UNX7_9PEZI|nr:GroES-like protein [Microthyrium microscopicum]